MDILIGSPPLVTGVVPGVVGLVFAASLPQDAATRPNTVVIANALRILLVLRITPLMCMVVDSVGTELPESYPLREPAGADACHVRVNSLTACTSMPPRGR